MSEFTEAQAESLAMSARLAAAQTQYAVFVTGTERIIDRRAEVSRFFLTLNTALAGGIGFFFERALKATDAAANQSVLVGILCLAGIAACYIWRAVIVSYRRMLNNRYEVIRELEGDLPLRPHQQEMDLMGQPGRNAPVTNLELRVPILFILAYLGVFALQMPGILDVTCGGLAQFDIASQMCPAS